jgi:hypothetical protein
VTRRQNGEAAPPFTTPFNGSIKKTELF